MKRIVTLLLALMLVLASIPAALADTAAPLVIEFWHTRGSGANYEVTKASVDEFNATIGKEKGIEVVEIYSCSYADIVTKLQLAAQTDSKPAVAVCAGDYISTLLDDQIIADMAPYAAETGFDFSVFFDALLEMPGNGDGMMHSVPYVKSTPVLYYNKGMADAKGLAAPRTVEELEAFCKALNTYNPATGDGCWGFEMFNNISYIQGNWLWQLGEPFLAEGGKAPCLHNSLLHMLKDWERWLKEGWCRPFDSTNAGTIMKEMFYQGKLAAFVESCGSLGNVVRKSAEAGVELGVANFPTYDVDNPVAVIGGGELVLIDCDNTDAVKRAGWEFIQFLMSDEQIARNAIKTGYLPTTKDISENKTMADFWAENPLYKVAYEQLSCARSEAYPYFENRAEFRTNCQSVISLMVQEGSITAEEAVERIKLENAHLFENGF